MNKQKGFTLIELMIVIIILGSLAAAIISVNRTPSLPVNGTTLCKGGMLFNQDVHGYQQQVIGPNGGGVNC